MQKREPFEKGSRFLLLYALGVKQKYNNNSEETLSLFLIKVCLKILFGICKKTKFPIDIPYFSSLGVPV